MRWQYRTIVFEFQKDGLLGDRFIDDEEVEQILNEQGQVGWELVSATMIQEGLLTLFKRPGQADDACPAEPAVQENVVSVPDSVVEPVAEPVMKESFSAESLQAQEQQERFLVGDIKIS